MTMRFRSSLQTLPTYQPGRPVDEVARELGMNAAEILKLASNENPLGPSPKALVALSNALASLHRYPDGNAFHLKKALSEAHALPPSQLVIGNGSNELIELLGHLALEPEREVVFSQYGFAIYPLVTKLFNATPREVAAQVFGHDLEAMLKAINERTAIVFIANPNNPTGTEVSPDTLMQFIRRIPAHVLTVIDEAYIEYLANPIDLRDMVRSQKFPNLVLLRTFSKIYGLAGLRVGYAMCGDEVASMLDRVRQPFNVNAAAQSAAVAALGDHEHISASRAANAAGLKLLSEGLQRSGFRFIPSRVNFLMVQVGNGSNVAQRLQTQGVIVRPLVPYGLAEWIRVTIGTKEENERFLSALQGE